MIIREGAKWIEKGTKKSIVDIECNDRYEIYVFQGRLSDNDIIVKYFEKGKRTRTPKHIHWAVDMLMKLQGNKKLARDFLYKVQKEWERCSPLQNNDLEYISSILLQEKEKINLSLYEELNKYGEYEIEFLFALMQLLMVQEKTNREDAFMFGHIINKLLEDELDIFSIMSTAGYGGRH